MINSLSIAVHTFARFILRSPSVDETLLSKYVTLSTNFRGPLFRVEMAPSQLKHILHFVCVQVENNVSSYLLQAMQQGFGLGRCICIVSICYSFCKILSASYHF